MKKIFALALAAIMTAGMTTVAFAADEEPKAYLVSGVYGGYVYADTNDDVSLAVRIIITSSLMISSARKQLM